MAPEHTKFAATRENSLLTSREVARAAHAVDSHVLVARARARIGRAGAAHERRALVERLEARDAGGRQRPVRVRPDRNERPAPAEGVGQGTVKILAHFPTAP